MVIKCSNIIIYRKRREITESWGYFTPTHEQKDRELSKEWIIQGITDRYVTETITGKSDAQKDCDYLSNRIKTPAAIASTSRTVPLLGKLR